MAMCAGVQNVSRPMVRCHEMSQITPTIVLVAASNAALRYQGTVVAREAGMAVAVIEIPRETSKATDAALARPRGAGYPSRALSAETFDVRLARQGTDRRAARFQSLAGAARRPRHSPLHRHGVRLQRLLAAPLPRHRHRPRRAGRLEDQHPRLDVHAVFRVPGLVRRGVRPLVGTCGTAQSRRGSGVLLGWR